jgi:transcriptional regulator with XRE-family HTH domain
MHLDDPVEVGRRLKEARLRAKLSLRDLAFSGCSAAYLSHIERGDRTPSLQVLVELARRLGLAADYLAWGSTKSRERNLVSDGASPASASGGRPGGHAFETYCLALRAATTARQRSWALIGIAQYALASGDTPRSIYALREALALLVDGVDSEPAANEATSTLDRRQQESDNRALDESTLPSCFERSSLRSA